MKEHENELLQEIVSLLNQIVQENSEIRNSITLPKKKYLKTREAREYLSCSENYLREFCIVHGIEPQKMGGSNYYLVADLDRPFANHPLLDGIRRAS